MILSENVRIGGTLVWYYAICAREVWMMSGNAAQKPDDDNLALGRLMDVGEKRVAKVLRTARRYLTWIQNSALEGDLTPAQLERLKIDVKKVIDDERDSVLLYLWRTERYMKREIFGVERGTTDFMI